MQYHLLNADNFYMYKVPLQNVCSTECIMTDDQIYSKCNKHCAYVAVSNETMKVTSSVSEFDHFCFAVIQ